MKGYCIGCDQEVPVILREEYQENTIKGVVINTLVNIVYCSECNEQLYIPQINDENLDRIEKQYRDLDVEAMILCN